MALDLIRYIHKYVQSIAILHICIYYKHFAKDIVSEIHVPRCIFSEKSTFSCQVELHLNQRLLSFTNLDKLAAFFVLKNLFKKNYNS